jgi:hypothetical protein
MMIQPQKDKRTDNATALASDDRTSSESETTGDASNVKTRSSYSPADVEKHIDDVLKKLGADYADEFKKRNVEMLKMVKENKRDIQWGIWREGKWEMIKL